MIDVCAVIERETGQKVNEDTPLDELQVDSLEYLELLVTLDVPSDGAYQTVGDLAKAAA